MHLNSKFCAQLKRLLSDSPSGTSVSNVLILWRCLHMREHSMHYMQILPNASNLCYNKEECIRRPASRLHVSSFTIYWRSWWLDSLNHGTIFLKLSEAGAETLWSWCSIWKYCGGIEGPLSLPYTTSKRGALLNSRLEWT